MNDVEIDMVLSVVFSDQHVNGRADGPTYQLEYFSRFVDEVLAMRPRPAFLVGLGDAAFGYGRECDYLVQVPLIRKLEEAGIEVVMTVGNHDHRAAFFKAYPEVREKSLVDGYVVRKVSLGPVDMIVLDTLNERLDMPEAFNPIPGLLSREVAEWLVADLGRQTRPVVVMAHHEVWDLQLPDGSPLARLLQDDPNVIGYVHGHRHAWAVSPLWCKNEPGSLLLSASIPSVGEWGDVGYAKLRAYPDRAELQVVMKDFFIPTPLPVGQVSNAWRCRVNDLDGARCTFLY